MDTFSLDKITAYVILDTRRVKKNNKFPVKYRICFMRKCIYYSSGRSLSIDEFADLEDPTKMKSERKLISEGFDRIKDHIKELVKGEGFSLELLNKQLSRGTKDSIYSVFQSKIDDLVLDGKIGTSEWYMYSKRSLEGFAGKELKYSTITKPFLEKYEKHLLKEGKSYTTISMYMRALQAIVNEGKRQGIIKQSQYPFGKEKYVIPQEESRNMALTLSQIKQVISYPLITQTEKKCRDLWLFSYLCNGINITDLLKLKYSNIRGGNIYYYRQKTIRRKKRKEIGAVILPKMTEIIEAWGNPEIKPDCYIFPILNENMTPKEERLKIKNMTKLINDKMTAIGIALSIGKISTYTARHSYATVLKRSGTDIAYISESLGHADVGVTETYLGSFEDDEMKKNADKLLNFR